METDVTALPVISAPFGEAPSDRRVRRVKSFHSSFRKRIQQTTGGSPAIEDLADTFPALLFALATGYGTAVGRTQTLQMIEAGAPLREAADALGLPWWLRRLPAEAFSEPLADLPDSPNFSQRVGAFMPEDPAASRVWLSAILYGYRAAHEAYALWVAGWIGKQHRLMALPMGEENLRMLAAWVWHAERPGTTGYSLLRRPWTPAMSYRRAFEELQVWRQRLLLAQLLECQSQHSAPVGGNSLGYEITPLTTAEEYVAEAGAMDNCLDQFAERVAQSYSRVYSIRRNGRSVANVEIGLHPEESSMPAIRQLRGPRNRRATPEVWKAVYAWLGAQNIRAVLPQEYRPDPAQRRAAARRFWQPYLEAIAGRQPEVPFRDLVIGTDDKPAKRNRYLSSTIVQATRPAARRRASGRAAAAE